MISYSEALRKLNEVARQFRIETIEFVDLDKALGRAIAQSVFSREAVPSFANSSMDGFLVRSEETQTASPSSPREFLVCGELAAGDWMDREAMNFAKVGTCLEIMTGAPVPEGPFDAVVRVEDVERFQDSLGQEKIRLTQSVRVGENIRRAGTDIQCGQEVLRQGQVFSTPLILAAAACGVTKVPVLRPLKVAVLSTGSELVETATPALPPGKIRNSTGPYLELCLRELGFEVKNYGLLPDNPELYTAVLQSVLASEVDLILTTGAVSMGKYDFIVPTLQSLKAQIHFHKVAIRPGKPILFAEIPVSGGVKNIPFFGMPGNPVSTAVGLQFFVRPFVREMLSLPPEKFERVPLLTSTKKPDGLRCFFKGRLLAEGGQVRAQIHPQQASYMVGNFADVDTWVILPEDGACAEAGQWAEVQSIGTNR